MMDKHSSKTFRIFAQYVYRQFGMRIAVLAAFRDSEGEAAISLYVYNLHLFLHTSLTSVIGASTPTTGLVRLLSKIGMKTGRATL
jgi:hypothetical protein